MVQGKYSRYETANQWSYYSHKEEDADSLSENEESLNRLSSRGDNVLLGGDFNFPRWDWESKQLKEKSRYPKLHLQFGEILDDRNLVQVVEKPTRHKATLDLLVINYPAQVDRVVVTPEISDHDIPLVEIEVKPIKRRHTLIQIPLYRSVRRSE